MSLLALAIWGSTLEAIGGRVNNISKVRYESVQVSGSAERTIGETDDNALVKANPNPL